MFFLPQLAFFIVSMLVFRGAIMFEKRVTVPLIPQLQIVANSFVFGRRVPKKRPDPSSSLDAGHQHVDPRRVCGQWSLWNDSRWRWRPGERCLGWGGCLGGERLGTVGGIQVAFPSMLVATPTHGLAMEAYLKHADSLLGNHPPTLAKWAPSSYNL